MRRFLSSKAYWVAGVLVAVFLLLLLLRPSQCVRFADGSVLTVVYSRYDKWHPIVYGKIGYAISQILPHEAIGEVNAFCLRVFKRGFFGGGVSSNEKSWQVELLLSGVDLKQGHPLLIRKSQQGGYMLDVPLEAVVEGNSGVRHGNRILILPTPKNSVALVTTRPACRKDNKVTVEIWKGGTNPVCSVVVGNPIKVLTDKARHHQENLF